MNTKKLYLILGISLVALGVVGGVFYLQKKEDQSEKTYGPDVLAVVDGMEITKADIEGKDKNLSVIGKGYQADSKISKNNYYLNKIVEEYIYKKEAEKFKIVVSEEEINSKIKQEQKIDDPEELGLKFAELLRTQAAIEIVEEKVLERIKPDTKELLVSKRKTDYQYKLLNE